MIHPKVKTEIERKHFLKWNRALRKNGTQPFFVDIFLFGFRRNIFAQLVVTVQVWQKIPEAIHS